MDGAPVVGGSNAPMGSGPVLRWVVLRWLEAPMVGRSDVIMDSAPMVGCSGAPAESAPVQHLGIKALVWSGMARLVNLWYRETRGQSLVARDKRSISGNERQKVNLW